MAQVHQFSDIFNGTCLDSLSRNQDHLSRLHVPHILSLAHIKRTRFRSNTKPIRAVFPAFFHTAYDQGPKSIGVAHRYHAVIREHNAGEGALSLRHGVEDLVDLTAALAVGDEVEKELGVDAGLHEDTVLFEEAAQLVGV